MQPDMERFKSLLKEKKLKATPQRIAVHQAMLELGHASADMVVEHMSRTGREAKATTASVYNILSTFADLKIYARRMSANNKMYFDVNTFKHIHLYDRVNGEYRDIVDNGLIAQVESYLKGKKFRGYNVENIDIQIICHPSARRKKVVAVQEDKA